MRAPWSLQRRLTVGIVALLALISVAIGLSTAGLVQHNLLQRLDGDVRAALVRTLGVMDRTPPGELPLARDIVRGQEVGSFTLIVMNDRIVRAGYVDPSGADRALSPEQSERLVAVEPGQPPVAHELGDLGEYRLAAANVAGSGSARVVVGLPLEDTRATILELLLAIALFTGVGIFAAALSASVLVRFALRPLDRIVATTVRVSELPLSRGEVSLVERVPPENTDTRTEVGQVGAALNRLLDHVATALNVRQRSERKVRQFVSDASHELRTPLAAIRGYAELTRRGPHDLPEDVRHSLGRIESESVRMTSLVDELLLLARLDEGPKLDAKAVDLSRVAADAVSDAQAAGRDHRWRLDLPEEPVEVHGDSAQLHQVVANLLANARTHTPEGTEVLTAVERRGHSAVLTVSDTGPGIPQELQGHLFERFVRGDRSRSRKAGSTGLGLAIVHAIVDAHGGTVSVDSQPGRTVFRVELPANGSTPAT
jgi:two-component system OmpR family sensor kinase